MEVTRNKLSEHEKNFFHRMSNYLDTKIYFFGSIQRGDYFPSASDIDVDIFTHDENNTIIKLMNFLNIGRYEFKRVVYKLNTNKVAYGYKMKYINLEQKICVEISIYNEKYKDAILYEHNGKKDLPLHATILLVIIKFLYYTLGIIPSKWYNKMKRFILSTLIFKKNSDYVVIDPK
jgi:predicted nucleotidyltransferase